MIEYVKGQLAALTPASAVIETAGGVAYYLNITLPTFSALEGRKDARLYVHEAIRDDAWVLYGFTEERERELFRSLIGVSGVGAATAVIILSSLQGDELAAKTAERIIVDLRDKIKGASDTLSIQTPAHSDAFDEALAALHMLGFDKKQSEKALTALFKADPALKVEAAIKKALSMM